ncbi:MAG: tripartite tricarboxylate transporter substrate binding protein [Betaproteobacteria bacterium]|nr:tripartite tricarboxylate transporter substrate binding protein [Betaproteobacteria bacterium]
MCFVCLMTLGVGGACAQSFPTKPVRLVTAAPGGGNDFTARLIAPGLSARLGQQVLVDNRPSGVIPGDVVSRAQPDGYTLLVTTGILWILPFMQKVPFDPVKDFLPITIAVTNPNVLVVHPSLPVKSVKELIALAKAKPGELDYASGATGSSSHLAAELFKALAITSAKPSALLPGLPPIAAAGLPGYEANALFGIFAPAGTPAAIVNRLNQEVVRVLNSPDVKERFFKTGMEVVGSSPEEFAAAIRSDMARMGKVLKAAGIHPK